MKYQKHETLKVGDKIFDWTILEPADYKNKSGKKEKAWLCQCGCKNKTLSVVTDGALKQGKSHNCGINHKLNQYDLTGKFGIGYFKDGDEFYFDIEDFDKIKDYCWHKGTYGYAEATIRIENRQTVIKMHRLVMDASEDEEVDHIYHHNADNRKAKLRKCSHFENMHNKKLQKANKSGISGVFLNPSGKYVAQVAHKKNVYLGTFDTLEEAKEARLKYKRENNLPICDADLGICT